MVCVGGGHVASGLEVPVFLSILHGAFAPLVVHAPAALGDACRRHLIDDLFQGIGVAFEGPCDGEVAQGSEPNMQHFGRFIRAKVEVVGVGEDLACTTDAHAVMGVVEGGQIDVLAQDVVPNVEFRPIVEREDTEVLAGGVHAVEEVPQLRTLVFGVPLAEVVAVGKKALLRTCLFFVSSCPSNARVELVAFDGVDEGGGLQAVSACVGARLLLDFARIDGRLHTAHDQTRPQAFDEVVAKGNGLREVVSGVDVDEGHGDAARREGFGREMGHHDAVLSS